MASRALEIRQRPPEESAPVLEWDDFLTYALDWRQDQHLAAVGPTGQGKSTTIHGLVDAKRDYVAYLATKPRDATLEAYIAKGGYARVHDWPPRKGWPKRPVPAEDMPRRLVWPDATGAQRGGRAAAGVPEGAGRHLPGGRLVHGLG